MKSRILPFIFLGTLCAASAGVLYHASQTHPGMNPKISKLSVAGSPSASTVAATRAIPPAVAPPFRAAPRALPAGRRAESARAANPHLVESYGRLPLAFERNDGQTDSQVKFISRGHGYTMYLTGDEAVLTLRGGKQKETVKGQKAKMEERPWSLVRGPLQMQDTTGRALDVSSIQNPKSQIQNLPVSRTQYPEPSTLRMKLVGANPKARVTGLDTLPGKSNYFMGNDPKKWRTNVANYAKVKYEGVYPGIDLVYYGNQRQLEYDWIVAPGADPKAIAFEIETGHSKLENRKPKIGSDGDLVIATDGGDVRLHKPVVYQPVAPVSSPADRTAMGASPLQSNPKSKIQNPKSVDGRFVLLASNQVGFEVSNYDKTKPLVIDPVLTYSTYLGGSGDDAAGAVAVDSSGDIYVTGTTVSADFPVSNAYQGTLKSFAPDIFVAKLNANGSGLQYSTYLGGSGSDLGTGFAFDPGGNVYLSGITDSTDFPTLAAFQSSIGPGTCGNDPDGFPLPCKDSFVTKLNVTGSALVFSTYLGGTNQDFGRGVAVDSSGNTYVTGRTESLDFPTTAGAFKVACTWGDTFVTKLNSSGSSPVYSTCLGGPSYVAGIAADGYGNAYVTGGILSANFPTTPAVFQPSCSLYAGEICEDVFVTKLNESGSALVYSTFLGGNSSDMLMGIGDITVDSEGNAYVTGDTSSIDFPTTPDAPQRSLSGYNDAFVTKLDSEGFSLLYSTYLGGAGREYSNKIAVDGSGNAWVTGQTDSGDFPTSNAIQDAFGGAGDDAFVATLNPSGSSLRFSSYLGGTGWDAGFGIAVDSIGNAYVVGSTGSPGFPTTAGAFDTTCGSDGACNSDINGSHGDAFVAKISLAPKLIFTPTTLDFGNQLVGTSASQSVTISNQGDLDLIFANIAASGDFVVATPATGTPCSTSSPVGIGLDCTVGVTFTPTVTGDRSNSLTIDSNDPIAPSLHFLLAGMGTDFAISIPPGADSKTVAAGGTATYNSQIVPTGFSGTVALACAFQGSAPRGASCAVSPNSVTANGVDPVPFTVNATTTARSLAAPQVGDYKSPLQLWGRQVMPLLLGLMMLMLALKSRRVREQLCATRAWAPLAATLLFVLLWAACGGGGPPPHTDRGTPAGTYNLTLTATAGGVSRTSTLTLIVN